MKFNFKKFITNHPASPAGRQSPRQMGGQAIINHQKGFTFIEILVVITIIGVLASIGVVSYQSANKKSRDTKRKADLEQIRAALEMYRADNGDYPLRINESSGWEISNDGDWLENLPASYFQNKPLDPINNSTYYYRYANCSGSVTATGQPTYKLYARIESGNNTQLCTQCTGLTGSSDYYCIASP